MNQMVEQAQANAESDKQAKESAEARNNLDSLKSQAQRVLDETDASDDAKQPVKDAISEAESALSGEADKAKLESVTQDLAEKLSAFQQANAPQAEATQETDGEANPETVDDDEDVIDADFKPAG